MGLERKLGSRLCATGFLVAVAGNVSAAAIASRAVRAIGAISPTLRGGVRIGDAPRAPKNLKRGLRLDPPKRAELEPNAKRAIAVAICGLLAATEYGRRAFLTFLHSVGASEPAAGPPTFYWPGRAQKTFFEKPTCKSRRGCDLSNRAY